MIVSVLVLGFVCGFCFYLAGDCFYRVFLKVDSFQFFIGAAVLSAAGSQIALFLFELYGLYQSGVLL